MNRRNFFTVAAGSTAATLLPSMVEAQSASSLASNAVHVTTTKLLLEQFRHLEKNPKHNIFASGKVSTAFRMHAEMMQAEGTNARIESAIRNGASTVYTNGYLEEQYATLAKLGVHLTKEQKEYATKQLIAASREATPTLRNTVIQGGGFVKMQQAAHSAMVGHQVGRKTASQQINAVIRPRFGATDAVYHPSQRPRLKRVDDWITVYADDWDDGEGGSSGGDGPGLVQGPGGSGVPPLSGPPPTENELYVNKQNTEVITPSGAHIQACTVYWATLALFAGVGGGTIAFLDAVGVEIGISVGIAVLSAAALVAIAAILVAVWGYLAVVC